MTVAGHRAAVPVVPAPVSVRPADGTTFTLTANARIHTADQAVGGYLARLLRRPTGFPLPVADPDGNPDGNPDRGIQLLLTGADERVGDQGYQLDVTEDGVVIRARRPAGLFAGVQTLRQLLPAAIESATAQPGPWPVPACRIVDHPRFAYRGAMLDVARHFFPVPAVERYLDEISLYKINHLHLHLSDDQGWRIAIDSWPRLTSHGASTQVGGGPGGYYTKDDYRRIVAYAAERFVTIVPEIDMPGHVNAALASYPELNCDGVTPPLYTETSVGFSTLCVDKTVTYDFVADVIGEVAALTPGSYLHIGGDEAFATDPRDYVTFMDRAQRIVTDHGKSALGWHQLARATTLPSTAIQYWGALMSEDDDAPVLEAARNGTPVLLSPANRVYLDMKYTRDDRLGLDWAGFIDAREAYGWDPGSYLPGVSESSILGVEAPLWTETVETMAELEYLTFPRLPAVAELGWSPASALDWSGFRVRLGAQGPRWTTMGVNFYRSPQVPWAG